MPLLHLLRQALPGVHAPVSVGALTLALLSCLATTSALGTASDYYVRALPGAPPGPLLRMHAGHIEVNEEHHGSLFFWHYQNRHIEGRQRTVIWLNGGPGCSSMDGALMEIGPYRVREGGNLEYNSGSWDEFSNLLFVDNPVGTGFSFVDSDAYVHELPDMANQFVNFLEKWFQVFPEYEQDDLYIAGESYAGQHIPYIAQAILDRNGNVDTWKPKWRLQGLMIGNGWISGEHQSTSHLDFSLNNGLIKPGSEIAQRVEEQVIRCEQALAVGGADHVDTGACEAVLQTILHELRNPDAPLDAQCINMYDIKFKDSYPSCGMHWPEDLVTVTPYLRDPRVIAALHIDPAKKPQGWTECNGQVGQAFNARMSKPSFQLLPGLLEQMSIILFSGADDLICNHLGTERLIAALDWNGGVGFPEGVVPHQWTFDGELAGTYQTARNLTYLLFYNSSHMVPFDYPRRTRDMLDRFIGLDPKLRFPASVVHGEDDLNTTPESPIDDPASKVGPPTEPVGDVGDEEDDFEDELAAEEEAAAEEERLQQARWDAYYRSGEVALVFVVLGAGFWGWYVLRDRRRRAGYRGVEGGVGGAAANGPRNAGGGGDVRLEAFRHKKTDLEEGRREVSYANGGRDGVGGVGEDAARRYSLGSAGSESTGVGEIGAHRKT